jgi:hypothetical protein
VAALYRKAFSQQFPPPPLEDIWHRQPRDAASWEYPVERLHEVPVHIITMSINAANSFLHIVEISQVEHILSRVTMMRFSTRGATMILPFLIAWVATKINRHQDHMLIPVHQAALGRVGGIGFFEARLFRLTNL